MNPLGHTARDNASALKCDLASEVLHSSGRLRLGVAGWSMLPTVWPGDTLVIEKAGCDEVCAGDLVLFGRHRRLFVHRVIAKNGYVTERKILTQGDGMPRPDEALKPSELLGRVSFILRCGRRFSPAPSLSYSERILAALVRRFYWAARIFVELHVVRQQETAAPCQN
jgi:signal peptidase I